MHGTCHAYVQLHDGHGRFANTHSLVGHESTMTTQVVRNRQQEVHFETLSGRLTVHQQNVRDESLFFK